MLKPFSQNVFWLQLIQNTLWYRMKWNAADNEKVISETVGCIVYVFITTVTTICLLLFLVLYALYCSGLAVLYIGHSK